MPLSIENIYRFSKGKSVLIFIIGRQKSLSPMRIRHERLWFLTLDLPTVYWSTAHSELDQIHLFSFFLDAPVHSRDSC